MIYGLYTLCIQSVQPTNATSEIPSTAIIWRRRMQGRKSRPGRVVLEKSTKERGDNLRQIKLVCLGAAFLQPRVRSGHCRKASGEKASFFVAEVFSEDDWQSYR